MRKPDRALARFDVDGETSKMPDRIPSYPFSARTLKRYKRPTGRAKLPLSPYFHLITSRPTPTLHAGKAKTFPNALLSIPSHHRGLSCVSLSLHYGCPQELPGLSGSFALPRRLLGPSATGLKEKDGVRVTFHRAQCHLCIYGRCRR